MHLFEKIIQKQSDIVLYGIVPPKKETPAERVAEIAAIQRQRLETLDIDGLVLYDIQDEESRTSAERPFPFMETLDSFDYARQQLSQLKVPKIIYRSVGKYSKEQLTNFLNGCVEEDAATVFVGAPSKHEEISMSVADAYELKKQVQPDVLLGGVTIPERHKSKGDEHIRVFHKAINGCSFFVSQGVYDIEASKNFLSDYYYYANEYNLELRPVIFTLTPCGSKKTLEFMKWLGISIPRWLENDLKHSDDILEDSIIHSEKAYKELREFALDKGIPVGCNIESVAVRKAEIEASIELLKNIRG